MGGDRWGGVEKGVGKIGTIGCSWKRNENGMEIDEGGVRRRR